MSAGYPERSGRAAVLPTFYEAPATPRSAPVGTAEHPLPLIIDSDPGLDDALAIGLALARPELDVLAVTTVGGNADVRHCTENALRLLHAYGRDDIPVAEGAAGPLVGKVVRATEVHGEAGIGSTELPPATARAVPEHGVELIARLLRDHPEPVAIAPIGPLTNIALVLKLYPELADRIAHLSIMGGSIGEGNSTVSAEFNIYADPEAADVVFRSGVPITMMGLDVTHQALLDRRAADALRATGTTSGRIAAELTDFALDRNMEWGGRTTAAIHDAVAVAHFAIADLVDVARYYVAVDTTDGPARGRTVCDGLPYRLKRFGLTPNAEVGIRIERGRFESVLLDAFASLP
ncbi:MAG TPA: nucleoside hydrolase [Candidatus Limnocylindrales bacterium]|nr:nucleoside hydrolase [Candidatus Limnocylindrales bacterium]